MAKGRVEVCIDGTYGTICDHNWDHQDASIVCSQLGFSPNGKVSLNCPVSDTNVHQQEQ